MGISIHLTDEQAKWLDGVLAAMIENNSWSRLPLGDDQKEHLETIYRKVNQKLAEGEWK